MKLLELTLFFIAVASPSASQAGFNDNLVKTEFVVGKKIPGRYIVKLKNQAMPGAFKQVFEASTKDFQSSKIKPNILNSYSIGSFNAHAVTLSESAARKLKEDPNVEYVEADRVVTMYASQTNPPSYGLTRISQKKLDLTQAYNYPDSAGEGIDVYVVDTGVDIKNPEFEGRATWGANFAEDGLESDGNGHGSHVAGTVAGKEYGVAKKANIIAVKVLNAQGSGTNNGVIAGINFVAQKAKKNKSVLNMSLGGGFSQAVNDAVKAVFDAGIAVIVAAGNSGADSCSYSPASSEQALAVVASDNTDNVPKWTNFGNCTDIIAPGVNITSIWNDGKPKTISGTSMASPHVAGVAALYLSQKEYSSPRELYDEILAKSTPEAIKGLKPQTPNKLVYNSITEDQTEPNPKPSPYGKKAQKSKRGKKSRKPKD